MNNKLLKKISGFFGYKLAYKNSSYTKLKNTEKFSKEIFSLPIYPTLEDVKIKKIISTINKI